MPFAPVFGSRVSVLGPGQATRGFILRAADMLFERQERARQRRQRMELDDRLVKDIGVTRAGVEGRPTSLLVNLRELNQHQNLWKVRAQ